MKGKIIKWFSIKENCYVNAGIYDKAGIKDEKIEIEELEKPLTNLVLLIESQYQENRVKRTVGHRVTITEAVNIVHKW